jgi:hypothetical protein
LPRDHLADDGPRPLGDDETRPHRGGARGNARQRGRVGAHRVRLHAHRGVTQRLVGARDRLRVGVELRSDERRATPGLHQRIELGPREGRHAADLDVQCVVELAGLHPEHDALLAFGELARVVTAARQ